MNSSGEVKLVHKEQGGRLYVLKSQAKRCMFMSDQQVARVHAKSDSERVVKLYTTLRTAHCSLCYGVPAQRESDIRASQAQGSLVYGCPARYVPC